MLVYIFFAISILLGVAALSIDMGYVRLSQLLMQNAADTAAIEGLRQRDATNLDCDSSDADANRRCAAAKFASDTFGNAGAEIQFPNGAGLGDFNASQAYTIDPSVVYQPKLQSNSGNDEAGDMIAGTYLPPASHIEPDDYKREDFPPAATPAESAAASSFLVRLRRTTSISNQIGFTGDPCIDTLPATADYDCGVSSSGSRTPLMFGRASLVAPDDSKRMDGVVVRATAIADGRSVLRVGSAGLGPPGVAPFAVNHASQLWTVLMAEAPQTAYVDGAGVLCLAPPLLGVCQSQDGLFYSPPAKTVGDPVNLLLQPGNLTLPAAYAPVYDVINGQQRVIGFALVTQVSGSVPGSLAMTGVKSKIAAANATAVVSGGFQAQGADLIAVIQANAALKVEGGLLAPALVR